MTEELITYIKVVLLGNDESLALLPEDDLLNSGLIDSMGIMRLITHIEKTYGLKVPPQDMVIENFMDVNTIVAYIEKNKNA